jgi:hypothetical protein
MVSEMGMIGRCTRARYNEPCKSLAYQVYERGIQKMSITTPIARSRFDVRLVSFIAVPECTRCEHPPTSNIKMQRVYFLQ